MTHRIETQVAAAVISAELYREAMDANPNEIANQLLQKASSDVDASTRATMRTGAVIILQLLAMREHYVERARDMEKRFGAI